LSNAEHVEAESALMDLIEDPSCVDEYFGMREYLSFQVDLEKM